MIGGPVLAIPVTVAVSGGRVSTGDVNWFVLPESLTLESELAVQAERRKLGVYEVPVYVVYALLYLLVTSEDYSLLAGSLAVFALLATAMVLTRRLDWYQATARAQMP